MHAMVLLEVDRADRAELLLHLDKDEFKLGHVTPMHLSVLLSQLGGQGLTSF
jgi:hypothetical protein